MTRPSTSVTGIWPAKVPVTNASSALYTDMRVKSVSTHEIPLSRQRRMTFARVIPGSWYLVVGVMTAPSRTMKKLVLLQVATKPWGSSIRLSSTPTWFAWMHAAMQLSLEWVFSCWSCMSGALRRTWHVCRRIPFSFGPSLALLCSGKMKIPGWPRVVAGFWYGVGLRPRET